MNPVKMSMVEMSAPPLRDEFSNYHDPNFTEDISRKMTVPKKLKVNGDSDDFEDNAVDLRNSWFGEKIEMHVPDRILAVGK